VPQGVQLPRVHGAPGLIARDIRPAGVLVALKLRAVGPRDRRPRPRTPRARAVYCFAFQITLRESQVSVTALLASYSVIFNCHFPELFVRALLSAPLADPS
jgi:hypothetical protein